MSRESSHHREFSRDARRDRAILQMEADQKPSKPQPTGIGFWVIAVGLVLGCAATVAAMSSSGEDDKYFVNSF
jgi:hypothetical protein